VATCHRPAQDGAAWAACRLRSQRSSAARVHAVWGAPTRAAATAARSDWKYVPVRRAALFLEESLYRGTQWAVFEPNSGPLWAALRSEVSTFMERLFRHGAFAGQAPEEGDSVQCDETTTTQADIDDGVVIVLVGFAPLRPAEFVTLRISQWTDAPRRVR
jgi:phage tail sheath protein FI